MAKRKASKKYIAPAKNELLIQNAFFERLRIALTKLIGDGYFEMIPKTTLLKCYNIRYPTVKMELDEDIIVDEKERKNFKEEFNNRLKTFQLTTLTGESISYASFFTECLLLIQLFNHLPAGEFKGQERIIALLKPYFTDEWYVESIWRINAHLIYYNYSLFDFYKGAVQFVLTEMRTIKVGGSNVIRLCRVPHEVLSVEIDKVVRPTVRLGYLPSNSTEYKELASASAEQFGVSDFASSQKFPVYIQHHALRRFQERAFDWGGTAFIHLGWKFAEGKELSVIQRKNHVLLAHHVGGNKIGYFVVIHHDDKWIIRTFLFLTNEGTPEGEKLKELTSINKIDAKYLKIDTMDAFIHHDIAGDEKLAAIFTEAGCEPLFEYAKFFDRTDLQLKDTDAISKYLLIDPPDYGF